MTDINLISKVQLVINKGDFDWRTMSGLAKELEVETSDIAEVLHGSEVFVKSVVPNGNGEELFTTVSRYKQKTPFLRRLFGAAANTVAS